MAVNGDDFRRIAARRSHAMNGNRRIIRDRGGAIGQARRVRYPARYPFDARGNHACAGDRSKKQPPEQPPTTQAADRAARPGRPARRYGGPGRHGTDPTDPTNATRDPQPTPQAPPVGRNRTVAV
ncbi:hypothetical protein [Burkholderia pseudomallei]|uniref:hypothetical protein n=2 Tax=Burkholderia pseudomallei TaxID=28450 RepID=UPI000976905F|nr:hypothetical protein [Burkholderia pseudomallei]